MNQKDICVIMQARVPTMRTLRSHHKTKKGFHSCSRNWVDKKSAKKIWVFLQTTKKRGFVKHIYQTVEGMSPTRMAILRNSNEEFDDQLLDGMG